MMTRGERPRAPQCIYACNQRQEDDLCDNVVKSDHLHNNNNHFMYCPAFPAVDINTEDGSSMKPLLYMALCPACGMIRGW